MIGRSELRLTCPALPERAKPLRHALGAFLAVLDVDEEVAADILTAVGETVINVIEHAYEDSGLSAAGAVEVVAFPPSEQTLRVDVSDRGTFIYRRTPRPDRGFGLRIVHAIARDVTVNASALGTQVSMIFDLSGTEIG